MDARVALVDLAKLTHQLVGRVEALALLLVPQSTLQNIDRDTRCQSVTDATDHIQMPGLLSVAGQRFQFV